MQFVIYAMSNEYCTLLKYMSANIMPHVRLFCTVKRIYFLFYSRENLIISSHETTKNKIIQEIFALESTRIDAIPFRNSQREK